MSAAHGIERWTGILDNPLLGGWNALAGRMLHAVSSCHP
jgi:hypothetical protein